MFGRNKTLNASFLISLEPKRHFQEILVQIWFGVISLLGNISLNAVKLNQLVGQLVEIVSP